MTRTMSSPLSSAPSSPTRAPANENLSAHLDSQIARLNAQLSALRQQKICISQTLLASTTVQNLVQSHKSSQHGATNSTEDSNSTYHRLEQAVEQQRARNNIKVSRLINNVTTFPFKDPAPERQHEGSMLGLRFEMPFTNISPDALMKMQDGEEQDDMEDQRVYLVMLRRLKYRGKTYLQFQPEMNQIPKHIDVEGFAERYIPVPDIDNENDDGSSNSPPEESFQDDSGIDVTQDLTQMINGMNGHQTGASTTNQTQQQSVDISDTNQSLPLFVTTTRDALLSWHYRKSHITHIVTSLTLSVLDTNTYKHSITHLHSNPAATQLTIDWLNGTTALLGITEKGSVGIARVFGPRLGGEDEAVSGHENGDGTFRCHSVERRVEGVSLDKLVSGLEEVGRMMGA